MSWDDIIIGTAQAGKKLPHQIDALLALQRSSWTAFREAESSLSKLASKRLLGDGAEIIVQANPGRRRSIYAEVDLAGVSRRPCFLCEENIPPEECGISFGDFVILPNPYPILRRHLTVPLRAHCPQKIGGRVESLLELAGAVGPDLIVIYNGARCGASAPDHFHFQVCGMFGVPLVGEVCGIAPDEGITAFTSFGRKVLVCQHRRVDRVVGLVRRIIDALASFQPDDEEPLVNMIALFRGGRFLTLLFPRAKHRPRCYFAGGASRISISPAALEMAGLLVVADPDHFDLVDKETALSIYEEVSLDEKTFAMLVEAVS